eukprot:TRINITY_DN1460_c0_g1_i2.p1 TRINITY_DN1460_c0_g1~~TRINITY_DN1460_c0_g1_i2.p1  ORF type:complete len:242 (-),score=63.89 TRINITY_DN1460_c0_g1_i2:559-1284(-)
MCGIGFLLNGRFSKCVFSPFEVFHRGDGSEGTEISIHRLREEIVSSLHHRGPDGTCSVSLTYPTHPVHETLSRETNIHAEFVGSVLSLRGDAPVLQPVFHLKRPLPDRDCHLEVGMKSDERRLRGFLSADSMEKNVGWDEIDQIVLWNGEVFGWEDSEFEFDFDENIHSCDTSFIADWTHRHPRSMPKMRESVKGPFACIVCEVSQHCIAHLCTYARVHLSPICPSTHLDIFKLKSPCLAL